MLLAARYAVMWGPRWDVVGAPSTCRAMERHGWVVFGPRFGYLLTFEGLVAVCREGWRVGMSFPVNRRWADLAHMEAIYENDRRGAREA